MCQMVIKILVVLAYHNVSKADTALPPSYSMLGGGRPLLDWIGYSQHRAIAPTHSTSGVVLMRLGALIQLALSIYELADHNVKD